MFRSLLFPLSLLLSSAAFAVPALTDQDGDGYEWPQDCDDYDDRIYPGAPDPAGDGIDQDCDGEDGTAGDPLPPLLDQDGDGFDVSVDCDDNDSTVYPGAQDPLGDGIDQDCDGTDGSDGVGCWADEDGDGYGAGASSTPGPNGDVICVDNALDCDDEDASINPGMDEVLGNSLDDDCDGLVDEDDGFRPVFCDNDGDGYGSPDSDMACTDLYAPVENGDDCDDSNAMVNPGMQENLQNGIDDDCDGVVDEDEPLNLYCDNDGDGYGDPDPLVLCTDLYAPASNGEDCNDSDASIHPGVFDLPGDGIDQDCDGMDEGGCFYDGDQDGFGDPDQEVGIATLPCVMNDLDCDDEDPMINPNAIEVPNNGIDDDCDGYVDGVDPVDDADGDGYSFDDCNDADASIHPGAVEIPNNGIDEDCDGADLIEDCYDDFDGDGFGDANGFTWDQDFFPPQFDCVFNHDDCDDGDPMINPGAIDIPDNGIDEDCDGSDATDQVAPDADGDGYVEDDDCDDNDAAIYPGAFESCDGVDNDCDLDVDEGCVVDDDGDGFTADEDCDDGDPSVFPGAVEVCDDNIDQDCNGQVDDDCEVKPPGCTTSGAGATFAVLILPLLFRRRQG